eukprot:scaffold1786_cov104-Skeletonema_dohrnii-CCMP3373.AAC.2
MVLKLELAHEHTILQNVHRNVALVSSCEGNVTPTRRYTTLSEWDDYDVGGFQGLLSSSLSPHSPVQPDHSTRSRRNLSFNSRITNEVQQQSMTPSLMTNFSRITVWQKIVK